MDRQIIKLIPDFSNTNVLATSAFQVIISITKRTQPISNFFFLQLFENEKSKRIW